MSELTFFIRFTTSPPTFGELRVRAEDHAKKILDRHGISLLLPTEANVNTRTGGFLDVDKKPLWFEEADGAYGFVFFKTPPHGNAFGVKILCHETDGKRYWSLTISRSDRDGFFQNLALAVTASALAEISDGDVLMDDPSHANARSTIQSPALWFLNPTTAPTKKHAQWAINAVDGLRHYAAMLANPPQAKVDEEEFWRLIETAKKEGGGEPASMVKILKKKLKGKGSQARQEFGDILEEKIGLLDSEKLWQVAAKLKGRVSDDGFEYFRAWIIGDGKDRFNTAVENPRALLDSLKPGDLDAYELEEMLYLQQDAG